ncbi:hypothetical protein C8A00DRAFT_43785 [Chaetomidium leptoderma]|uniref:DUF1772-domain-containing protein n=1 Tax=Chaetomidium leptoderma TaxID=669021 RepID=A0AAN6ZWW1_9PEZI|nr:hypothetical protein C8A00DRAFT_43785 [Chaetomidium leptoderma]
MAPPTTVDTTTTLRLAKGTALLLSSLGSGIILSLSTFVVPRLLESPTPLMLRQWVRSFRLGAATMPLTAAVSAATYFWLGLRSPGGPGGALGLDHLFRSRAYLAAGALTAGIVPYTIVFMSGTNTKLMALEERVGQAAAAEAVVGVEEERGAKGLLDWWGVLNLGRAGMMVAGVVCGLVATL